MIEWEELLAKLQRLNSVALRVDNGTNLVEELGEEKLNEKNGRMPDMDETKVVEEISTNWIASSNYKVSLLGIDLLDEVVRSLGPKFKSIITKVIDQLVSKFGDVRTQNQALQMFLNIFVLAFNGPDPTLYERILLSAWNDRGWRVREGGCHLLRHTLDETIDGHFDGKANSIGLSKLMPRLIQLADGDKQIEVREAAVEVLQAGYRCFGEKLRNDLIKKRPKRLNQIISKLDEISPSDLPQTLSMKPPSRPASRNGMQTPVSRGHIRQGSGTLGRNKKPGPGGDQSAGAMGVSEIENEYEKNLPNLSSLDLSDRSIEHMLDQAIAKLTATSTEWEDRNKELRLIRALALQNLLPQRPTDFRKLAPPLTQALSDLRSQVTREACVTLGLLSSRVDELCFGQMANLGVISQLIKLIPNSAKIMSSSAVACLSIILRECHYSKFPPIFTDQLMTSKSILIRRKCIDLIGRILDQWTQSELIKSNDEIVKSLTKTLQDADNEVRQTAREAFVHYSAKFPDQSDKIQQSLPANVKKMLSRAAMSRSNSTESISSTGSKASLTSTGNRTPGRPKTTTFRPTHTRQQSGSRVGMRQTPSRPTSSVQRPGLGNRGFSDLGPGRTSKFNVYTKPQTFTPSRKFTNIESRYSQKNLTPGRKPVLSQPGSRSSSPPHPITSSNFTSLTQPRKKSTPSRIPRSAAASREASPEDTDRFNRRILPPGTAGQRIINDILGIEQIVPKQAIAHLASAKTTAEKKDALSQIGKMADQKQRLTASELHKVTEHLQKIILNEKERTLIPALKIIPKVLQTYATEDPMKDWLYALLTGILKRLNQLLGEDREAALEVLDSIRSEYPKELQYARVTKFLLDQTSTPTTGQKAAILRFVRDLAPTLESSTIQNNGETRLVISRLVGWCNDQKSPDVRTEASATIRALFGLNPAQFSAALQELPKPFQEGASKALQALHTPSHSNPESPDIAKYPRSKSAMQDYVSSSSFLSKRGSHELASDSTDSLSKKVKDMTLDFSFQLGKMDNDDEFLAVEQTLKLELDNLDTTGVLEPIQDNLSNRPGGGSLPSLLIESIKLFQRNDAESIKIGLKKVREAIKDSRHEDWDRHWPRIFPTLLEIAANSLTNGEERLMSLHCLRDAVDVSPELMIDSAGEIIEKYLTIMSTDHDDRSNRDVSRAAQNAAIALLRNISIWKSLSILADHVSESVPIGRDSIDLCRLLIEDKSSMMKDESVQTQQAQNAIHQLLPRLMKQWQSEHAALRKAVVYCLVMMYLARREIVEPYITQASQTNRRLFDLYLKKHSPEK